MKVKRGFLIIILAAGLAFLSACGQDKPDPAFNDINCIIGNESEAKSGRYIAKFLTVDEKARYITFSVYPQKYTVAFDEKTEWGWYDGIGNINSLKKKRGLCISIDYGVKGKQTFAKKVSILSAAKVAEKMLIDLSGLKKIMKAVPSPNKKLVIIDSRPEIEWKKASIPGSINIPLTDLESGDGLDSLPADKKTMLVFYCGGYHCRMAPSGASLAVKAGYKDVRVYHAGYPDWSRKGNAGFIQPDLINAYVKERKPYILIDIREAAHVGHIPGALSLAKTSLKKLKDQLPDTRNDRERAPIIVYGNRKLEPEAIKTANTIASWGYRNVTVIAGGWEAYKIAGRITRDALVDQISYSHKKGPGELSAEQMFRVVCEPKPVHVGYLDIRRADEVAAYRGMLKLGADNISFDKLKKEAEKLDKKKVYYLFCSSGVRARLARDILKEEGIESYYMYGTIKSDGKGGLLFDDFHLTPKIIKRLTAPAETKKVQQKNLGTSRSGGASGNAGADEEEGC